MDLSVIVVVYDMAREIPRTLQSLSRSYQENCEELSYEVLVIDNGSPNPVDESVITSVGPEFKYHRLENPPPSPAYALNYGAEHASGETLCFMVDGAHMVTPGAFYKALGARRALTNAVAMLRFFYMGPGQQNETILQGYSKAREDELLREIDWPNDGYRLFEVGSPDVPKGSSVASWFFKPLESNCLFMSARHFKDIGGAEERFDIPGGGLLNMDLLKRACDSGDATPVMLIGEGSFHQLHGGTTTNIPVEVQEPLVEGYKQQYREIRGEDMTGMKREIFYFGHMPTTASKIHRKPGNNKAGAKAVNR
tara:strand:+ start:20297 stop:21223 length:927 start_codon:yes stop_codon:yes gene_type:complete